MKKLILFISIFIVGNAFGQTVTVQNTSTWFDLVIGGYNEYDCSSSASNICWTSVCHQTPSMTTNSFTASVGSLVDASIYGLNTGGPPANVSWTDLPGGDVLIFVF
jgi:hypothetical protein